MNFSASAYDCVGLVQNEYIRLQRALYLTLFRGLFKEHKVISYLNETK